MKMAILVLAAGSSSRMGRPKQLLRAGSKTLLQRSLETALASQCRQVYCVLGAHASEIKPYVEDYPVQLIDNPRFQQGLSSSLRAGIEALEARGAEAVLVLLADMPNIHSAHLNALMELFHKHPRQPAATAYPDGPGVPVVFPASHFPRLKALEGDKGARVLLNEDRQTINSLPFDDLTDIDTPRDYALFLKQQQGPTAKGEAP